ncbi:P13 [Perigonia lusca single nucleopolyhedrovirus]|uniref:p13 n=1 Tax=Perigonia lusca single nucleopolyhedrovirus TaxID=1675865 RepID=A0A0M3WP16_9ABAC|nr:P13 [Perigonia lusca single nucleopolyhedrovirus]AKN80665.1 P13 [Perigonia lusca single nucleopolyhedrovirus]
MHAYVTLVMLGDKYVDGAIGLAKSLRLINTTADLVCMVTSDVSQGSLIRLQQLYTHVIYVDFISFPCPPMLTKRQNQMYGPWINHAFTKWQCLKLTQYEKIIYLDADHLVVKNIDHMFMLKAPAVCFTDENYGYYDDLKVGTIISPKMISNFMKHNKILCKAGTILLRPNIKMYRTLLSLIGPHNPLLNKCQYHNGFDEQVLLQTIVKMNISVTQLCVLYAWNAGSYQRLRKNHEPFVINYYGDKKPWDTDDDSVCEYMDVYIWKYLFNKTIN